MNPYDSYWRSEAKYQEAAHAKARARVNAACQAVGAAGYVLSPACSFSNARRLVELAEIIAELRTALGLSDDQPAGHQGSTDTTTGTGTRAAGGEGL